MYQRVGQVAYKANLDNTIALASYLGNPEKAFPSVHVAGTNGKGSVSHMLASVLQEAGFTVGLYTSPHLKDFRERIKVNGTMVPEDYVVEFMANHRAFFEQHQLSFFEMTVGLAFQYFKSVAVDIAIVEVGMGGRLDSTNIITPEVSVITNIGMDHTQFLGNTLAAIAREKAGIIKEGIPVVIGENHPETLPVFEQIANERSAPLLLAEKEQLPHYTGDLLGMYQKKNRRTAVVTLRELQRQQWELTEAHIVKGLQHTIANTGLMGRWQQLKDSPRVVCDTAHNKEGLQLVMEQLMAQPFDLLHIVLGVVEDKDLDAILPLFPKGARYYFCKPNVPRGLHAELLQQAAQKHHLMGEVHPSVAIAYRHALERAASKDFVFVGGSTFTVAEVV
jgi:dihydrofolate synthase/folylpolyglutamate synthase